MSQENKTENNLPKSALKNTDPNLRVVEKPKKTVTFSNLTQEQKITEYDNDKIVSNGSDRVTHSVVTEGKLGGDRSTVGKKMSGINYTEISEQLNIAQEETYKKFLNSQNPRGKKRTNKSSDRNIERLNAVINNEEFNKKNPTNNPDKIEGPKVFSFPADQGKIISETTKSSNHLALDPNIIQKTLKERLGGTSQKESIMGQVAALPRKALKGAKNIVFGKNWEKSR